MKLVFLSMALMLSREVLSYHMMHDDIADYITCMEQNDEQPEGFGDKEWGDSTSLSCLEHPTLCDIYQDKNINPYPGKGDVCDHFDSVTGDLRDTCYFNTIFGEKENAEKTWSYKCWKKERCPVTDADDVTVRMGCQVTEKRINCCCQDDFCNGSDLIKLFAQWGRADHYPPRWQEICDYDYGDVYVKWVVPGWEDCTHDPLKIAGGGSYETGVVVGDDTVVKYETGTAGVVVGGGGDGYLAAEAPETVIHAAPVAAQHAAQSSGLLNVADIMLIFTYFVIGIVCLGIGVFIGSKWQQSVVRPREDKGNQLDI